MNKESTGDRIDIYLYNYLKQKGYSYISRSFLKSNWEKELILINGEKVKPSYRIREKDTIKIDEDSILQCYELTDFDNIESQHKQLDVVYEDSDFLVLNKNANISIHPGIGNEKDTLANYVRGYLEEKGEYDGKISRAGVVHRLDKSVSGLVVFAKKKETQLYLQEQFQERNVNKVYHAILEDSLSEGVLKKFVPNESLKMESELTILEKNNFKCDDTWYKVSGYISRSNKNRMKMQFLPLGSKSGKRALSYIKPLNSNELLIKIETGRMHQIRATLAYLGVNIKGDTLYASSRGGEIPDSIGLYSVLLSFFNKNGKILTFKLSK